MVWYARHKGLLFFVSCMLISYTKILERGGLENPAREARSEIREVNTLNTLTLGRRGGGLLGER